MTSAPYFVLTKLIPLSSNVWSIVSAEFWWGEMYSLIFFWSVLSSLIRTIDSISVFLGDESIKWTVVFNVAMRKVWSSYNIITVWCVEIIWFVAIDVWDNVSTYPLLILVQNLPTLFLPWQHKHHTFFFCRIVHQYNQNWTFKLISRSMPWASIIDWWRENIMIDSIVFEKWLKNHFPFYHYEFIIRPNHKHDIEYEKMGAPNIFYNLRQYNTS